MRRIAIYFFLITLFLSANVQNSSAYSIDTHAALTQETVKFYSKFFSDNPISENLKYYLMDGARREDDPPRWYNHYYDPVYERGLVSIFGNGLASKIWSQDSKAQTKLIYNPVIATILGSIAQKKIVKFFPTSDFTWKAALKYWIQGNKEMAMFTLGHILHLIQDASSPPHTRNDAHPDLVVAGKSFGDMDTFEGWTRKFTLANNNVDFAKELANKQPIVLSDLNVYFSGIANYSNKNFYSDDTIGIQSGYSLPVPVIYERKGDFLYALNQDLDGYFALYKQPAISSILMVTRGEIIVDAPDIQEGYWSRLAPKSVQYSAGVINFFFKEAERLKDFPEFQAKPEPGKGKAVISQILELGKNVLTAVSSSIQSTASFLGSVLPSGQQSRVVEEIDLKKEREQQEQSQISKELSKESEEKLDGLVSELSVAKPAVSVNFTDFYKGEMIYERGSSFTPGAEVTMFFDLPDKKTATASIKADKDGNYENIYIIPDDAQEGIYYYYAKDTTTGWLTDKVKFQILGEESEASEEAVIQPESEEEEKAEAAEKKSNICVFDADQTPSHSPVIINEVAWMGSSRSAGDEWIELKNISNEDVYISGWRLLDKNEKINITFKPESRIKAGGFFLLERTDDNSSEGVNADLIYSGVLSNSREGLRLFDSQCRLADEAFAEPDWPAGDAKERKTMERNRKNFEWHTSSLVEGTPKQENSMESEKQETAQENEAAYYGGGGGSSGGGGSPAQENPPADTGGNGTTTPQQTSFCSQENFGQPSRQVLINEVAWAGTINSPYDEWIELRNTASTSVELNSWQLLDKQGDIQIVFGEDNVLQANSFYLLERTDDGTVPEVVADFLFSGSINNSGESLRLFDSNCNLVDEVVTNAGDGNDWPAGDSAEKRTAERTGDLQWQTYSGDGDGIILGTPKAANSAPPENPPDQQANGEDEQGGEEPPLVSAVQNFNVSFSSSTLELIFSWDQEPDYTYEVLEYSSPGVSIFKGKDGGFSKQIREIGRDYRFTVQAFDSEAKAVSELTEKVIAVPSLFESFAIYPDLRQGKDKYLVEFSKNFALWNFASTTMDWNILVFYSDSEPAEENLLGYEYEVTDKNNVLRVKYERCSGNFSPAYSLIIPWSKQSCSVGGGVTNAAFRADLMEDNNLIVETDLARDQLVLDEDNYLTAAWYKAINNGKNFQLAAIDKTKFYFQPDTPGHSVPSSPQNLTAEFNAADSSYLIKWNDSSDEDSLDRFLTYEVNAVIDGQDFSAAGWKAAGRAFTRKDIDGDGKDDDVQTAPLVAVVPGEEYKIGFRAKDDFGNVSEPAIITVQVSDNPPPFGVSNIRWKRTDNPAKPDVKAEIAFNFSDYLAIFGESPWAALVFYKNISPPDSAGSDSLGNVVDNGLPKLRLRYSSCSGSTQRDYLVLREDEFDDYQQCTYSFRGEVLAFNAITMPDSGQPGSITIEVLTESVIGDFITVDFLRSGERDHFSRAGRYLKSIYLE